MEEKSEEGKKERQSRSRAHIIKKGVPGVRHLKRRLTDPGIGLPDPRRDRRIRNSGRKEAETVTRTNSKDTSDFKEEIEESEDSEVPKFKAHRLCPKDNIGKDYLLDIKPEETLITKSSPKQPTRSVLKKSLTSTNIKNDEESSDEEVEVAFDSAFKIVIEQERKRQMIIAEMMQTEKTYLEFIQTLVMLFIVPLRKSLEKDSVPLLTEEQIEMVFQNIEEILTVNGELLRQMAKRKRKSTVHWADMLLQCWSQEDFIQAYQDYINGYTQARLFVSCAMKPLPPNPTEKQEHQALFAEFVNKQLSNDLCLGFGSLTSFLITPIQRLPRYLLYLKDLHSCTPEGHPDRNDVEQAYELLSKMTVQIDQQKLKYDEMYHLQALHQRFVPRDRSKVPEILDPSNKLIAEGPLLENIFEDARSRKEREKVLRYIILFSNALICATKDDDDILRFEWKARLYSSYIQHVAGKEDVEEHFIVRETNATGGFPSIVTNVYYLFPFAEGPFSSAYWMRHLQSIIEGPKELFYHTKEGVSMAKYLQSRLMMPNDWEAFKGKRAKYSKDEAIQKEDATVTGFSLIMQGRCCIAKQVNNKQVLLGIVETGELLGEMSFLSANTHKKSTSSIIAISDPTTILHITFEQLQQIVAKDYALAKRFFHHMCTTIASRYLKVVFQKTGSYAKAENASFAASPSPTGSCKPETLSILTKLNLAESEIIAEVRCKVKGKIGRGYLIICKTLICCYSRAVGLFGHLSKTVVMGDSIRNIEEFVSTSSLVVGYIDSSSKHKAFKSLEISFYSDAQRTSALIHLASFVGHHSLATGVNKDVYDLTAADWTILTNKQKHIAFEKGEIVVKPGVQLDGIFQVVKGKCKVVYSLGENELGFTIKTGDIYGEIPFILGIVTSASLVAIGKQTVVRLISYKHLNKILFRKHDISAKFYLFLARSLRSRFMSLQQSLLQAKDKEKERKEIQLTSPTLAIESDSSIPKGVAKTISDDLPLVSPRRASRPRTHSFQGETMDIAQQSIAPQRRETISYSSKSERHVKYTPQLDGALPPPVAALEPPKSSRKFENSQDKKKWISIPKLDLSSAEEEQFSIRATKKKRKPKRNDVEPPN